MIAGAGRGAREVGSEIASPTLCVAFMAQARASWVTGLL